MTYLRICLVVSFSLFLNDCLAQEKRNSKAEELVPQRFHDQARDNPGVCIIRGNKKSKQIALTFDDGPGLVSSRILDILNKHNAKATFFWLGSNLSEHPGVVKRAIQDGHQIANHSWDHPNMWETSTEELWSKQVEKTNKELKRLTNSTLELYRPPFGAVTDEQIKFLSQKGMKTVLWSISTDDWDKNKNSSGKITSRVMDNLHSGAIVLMHDFDPIDNPDAGSNRNGMLTALERIITKCSSEGYKFVTIDQLMSISSSTSKK